MTTVAAAATATTTVVAAAATATMTAATTAAGRAAAARAATAATERANSTSSLYSASGKACLWAAPAVADLIFCYHTKILSFSAVAWWPFLRVLSSGASFFHMSLGNELPPGSAERGGVGVLAVETKRGHR